MPPESAIDPEAIENLRALNPEDADGFLREIVAIFLEDTPARIAEMKECLGSNDQQRFTRAAHSIKGSASNLGAGPLRAVAEKLEHQSRNQGLGNLEGLIGEIEGVFATTKQALENILPPA